MTTLPNPYQDSSADRPILGYNKKNSGFVEKPKRTSLFQWVPSDADQLKTAEQRMLKPLEGTYQQTMVKTPLCEINTLMCESPLHDTNIVLLHGFGFGLAQWVPNISTFAQHGNVYALDMPGFARSGRVPSVGGGQEALLFFIQTLEEWIKAMWGEESNGKKITLVGHSFGGFISGKFALNYPHRIEKLILVDPFGVNEGVPDEVVAERAKQRGTMEKIRNSVANTLFYKVNPLCPLRGLGPLAPSVVGPKMAKKRDQWQGHTEEGAVVDYLYHANAQSPSGESAFSKCVTGLGAGFGDGFIAKAPLLHELPKLDPSIPLAFIYGSHTWIPHNAGYQVVRTREEYFRNEWLPAEVARRSELPEDHPDLKTPILRTVASTKCHVVNRAGHHVYVDNAKRFNGLIAQILCPFSERRRVISQPNSASNRTSSSSPTGPETSTTTTTVVAQSQQQQQQQHSPQQQHADPMTGIRIAADVDDGAAAVSSFPCPEEEQCQKLPPAIPGEDISVVTAVPAQSSSSHSESSSMRVTLRGPQRQVEESESGSSPLPSDKANEEAKEEESNDVTSSSFDVVSSVSPSIVKEEKMVAEDSKEKAEKEEEELQEEAGRSVQHSLNAWDEEHMSPLTTTAALDQEAKK